MVYVNARSGYDFLTDPYMGEFGALGADPFTDPSRQVEVGTGGGSSVDESALVDALVECAASGIRGGPGAVADCLWGKVRELLMTIPEVEAALTMIVSSSCSEALSALGLPSTASSAVCGLGADVWREVQRRARDELIAYREGRTSREARPVSEGGGTVIRVEGEEPRIACVADVEFGPTVLGNPGDLAFRCPAGTGGVPQPGAPRIMAKLPSRTLSPMRLPFAQGAGTPDTYKSGAKVPWYKNKWIWIGAAAVGLGATAIVVVRRRGRRG